MNRNRMTLKEVLIIITIASVVLSFIRTNLDRLAAINRFRAAGGMIVENRNGISAYILSDTWNGEGRDLNDLRYVPHVTAVVLQGSELHDEAVGALCHVERLRHLTLDCPRLSRRSLGYVASCKSLESLTIMRCQVGGAELRCLSRLARLKELWIENATVTAVDIGSIAMMPQLKKVALLHSAIDDSGAVYFSRMRALESLDVSSAPIGPGFVTGMQASLSLRRLIVTDCGILAGDACVRESRFGVVCSDSDTAAEWDCWNSIDQPEL